MIQLYDSRITKYALGFAMNKSSAPTIYELVRNKCMISYQEGFLSPLVLRLRHVTVKLKTIACSDASLVHN